MKKVLFIDRDGTLVIEPPVDYQLDSLEKLEFYPKVMRNLGFVRSRLDFEFVMVTNQDGLGTASFPEETFWPAHNLMMKTLEGEGIAFDDICIDRSMPEDNAPTRKPRTGMLTKYLDNPKYDLANSFVIGDRATDVELAKNLGCRAILLQEDTNMLKPKSAGGEAACEGLEDVCVLATKDWDKVAEFLFAGERKAEVRRTTKETDIYVAVNLDGNGHCDIHTGLGFFDHMLEQIGKHGGMDLTIHVKGDLEVDEHHTIEDTALALGECLYQGRGVPKSAAQARKLWKAAAESGEPIALLNLGDDCAARGDNGKALLWYRRARQNAAAVPDIEYTPRVCLRLAQFETRYTSRKKALAQAAEAKQAFTILQREHEPDADRWLQEAEQLLYALTHEPPTAPAAYNIESLQLD